MSNVYMYSSWKGAIPRQFIPRQFPGNAKVHAWANRMLGRHKSIGCNLRVMRVIDKHIDYIIGDTVSRLFSWAWAVLGKHEVETRLPKILTRPLYGFVLFVETLHDGCPPSAA